LRYVDSATRLLADTIHDWLAKLLPSATAFACQSGYYRFDALDGFASDIEKLLASGGRFDLVIGANEERLSAPDLENTLELLALYIPTAASFTLVGASNGLFHPKTYYIELADGSRHAAVGSANLTPPGIGHNVEACILLDDSVDDPATLDAARDAILAWREKAAASANDARPVTREYIRELTAEGIVEPTPVRRPPAGTQTPKTGKSSFPALKRIAGIPAPRARRMAPAIASPRVPGLTFSGAMVSFPPGVIGIAKRLSASTDVKGFTAAPGTPYISLPPNRSDLASRLPLKPRGRNQEPRLDLEIQARLLEAPKDVVTSGKDTTNMTYVGMGQPQKSKVDLRLNVQHTVMNGLKYVASQRGLAVPTGGDFVAIEFLEDGGLARLTFVTSQPVLGALQAALKPGRSWGWLNTGVVPAW
jgi:PLD-like domain